jgi:hypothetical protein
MSEVEAHTVETVAAAAAKKRLVVVLPGPDELFVDIDSEEQLVRFWALHEIFERSGLSRLVRVRPSPSGKPGRSHVTVMLTRPVRDMFERVALQSLLGSDPTREMLSWLHLHSGAEDDAVTVFFEKPEPTELALPTSTDTEERIAF